MNASCTYLSRDGISMQQLILSTRSYCVDEHIKRIPGDIKKLLDARADPNVTWGSSGSVGVDWEIPYS